MATYRLKSSEMVHTPGIIAWAINGYAFADDRPKLLDVMCRTFPTIPATAIERLLSEAVPYTVEDEAVVFSVDD